MALAKVFRIELNGTKDVQKNAQEVRKIFNAMVADIKKAKQEMANVLKSGGDATAVTTLKTRITELEKSLKSLTEEKRKSEAATKSEAIATEKLATAKLRDAQADKERAIANKNRTADQIQQNKELDRQIALEEKDRRVKEKNSRYENAPAGSHRGLYAEYKKQYDILALIEDKSSKVYQDQHVKVKTLRGEVDAFNRSLTSDGTLVGEYTTGIVQAFKKMGIDDIIKNQINGGKKELESLKKTTNELVVAYRKAQQEGSADLNKLEAEIHQNVVETNKLSQSINNAQTQLHGIGGIGTQITNGLRQSFSNLRRDIGQFAIGFFGFQAALGAARGGIANAKLISDQTTDLEIQLKKAAGGADDLNSALGKIDTRTTVAQLQLISDTALKAGATEANILGVTKAIDTAKIAFGKDFGSVEEGTETLAKLINIFYEDRQITGERILGISNSIRALANETVASVPFINDFAGRMAGLRQISKITLPDVIGLGAGFEEFKQSAEVSSSALVKVIPKLATDVEKFAKIAGVTTEQFSNLLNQNPVEALLKVSEGLVKGQGDIEKVAQAFSDAELDAGRVVTILGTLGGKADVFRQRITLAGTAINNTGEITEAFDRKNTNLAATMDKIGKKFSDVSASKAFQATLLFFSNVIAFLLGNIPAVIGLLTLYAIGWLTVSRAVTIAGVETTRTNAQLVLQRLALMANNIWLGITRLATLASTIAQVAYNTALSIFTGVVGRAAGASILFGNAMRLLPLGAVLTVIALLVAGFRAFGGVLSNTSGALREQALRMQALSEINKRANQSIAEQVSQIDALKAVVDNTNISLDTRKKALQTLIDQNPAFRNALQGEAIDLKKLQEAYDNVTASIRTKARADAAGALSAEKQQDVLKISTVRQRLETEFAQGTGDYRSIGGFSKSELDIISGGFFSSGVDQQTNSLRAARGKISFLAGDFQKILDNLTKKEGEAIDIYQAYLKVQAETLAELTKMENEANAKVAQDAKTNAANVEVDIPYLKGEIERLDKLINGFRGAQADLNKLEAERDAYQKKLDAILGKTTKVKTPGASKLTGEQKDTFKDIDAIRDQLKAVDAKRRVDGEIDEKAYLDVVYATNVNAINQKLSLIKGKNAEERKIIAELNLEKVNALRETNQKLFDIDNELLEQRRTITERNAQNTLSETTDNPELSNVARIQATEEYYNTLLQSQIVFNVEQIALERQYGITSIENEEKRKTAIPKIISQIKATRKDEVQAAQADINSAYDKSLTELDRRIAQQTIDILNSGASPTAKAKGLAKLEADAAKERLANEVALAKISLDKAEENYAKRLISEKDYQEKLRDFKVKEAAFTKLTTDAHISATQRLIIVLKELKAQFLDNFLGIKKYTDDAEGESERVADAVKETQDTVKQAITEAYNNWFANEARKIEEQKQNSLDALERERNRVLNTAQSESERATIERQFEQKRRAIEKQASEDKKRNALKQLTIDLAISIGKAFAQFGFPLGLIPAAALTALYFVQRAAVQKQTFAGGGIVRPENPGNGKIFSRPNIPTQSNGDNVFATVKPGEVILNEAQQAKLGGASTFRSIGVPGFATGGVVSAPRFGSQLSAPVFTNGFNSGSVNANSNQDIEDLKGMVATLVEVVYASDSKDVILNPNKVTEAQSRKSKDTKLATL